MRGFNTANMPQLREWSNIYFISDTGVGLAAIAAANVDLVVFSYGINDIRTNSLTKDQKTNIITCINAIKAEVLILIYIKDA
jgi:hypothetical protein